jgi:hypothetical protein
MKEYTIADILHYAADNCLASITEEYWINGGNKDKFSCCAVTEACIKLEGYENYLKKVRLIKEGLENMGCPVESMHAFKDHRKFVEKNQQARYAWLKFAAMMAEEQGV